MECGLECTRLPQPLSLLDCVLEAVARVPFECKSSSAQTWGTFASACRRVLSRQAEIDQLRVKITELEAHIASQANFNPALMQQQIEELQLNVAVFERQTHNLNARLEVS